MDVTYQSSFHARQLAKGNPLCRGTFVVPIQGPLETSLISLNWQSRPTCIVGQVYLPV